MPREKDEVLEEFSNSDFFQNYIKKHAQNVNITTPIPKEEQIEAIEDRFNLIKDIELMVERIRREFKDKYEKYGTDMSQIIIGVENIADVLDNLMERSRTVISESVEGGINA